MSKTVKTDWNSLKTFGLFQYFEDAELKTIADQIKAVSFDAGETVCREDSVSDSMFFIKDGKVTVSKEEAILAGMEGGDYFGEMAILGGKSQRAATVVAEEAATLFEVSKDVFKKHFEPNPQIIKEMAVTFERRLKKSNAIVVGQFMELQEKYRELEQATDKLVDSEKMAALGLMAGSIAHEINTPLTVIGGKAELLEDSADEGDLDPEEVKEAAENG